MKIKQRQIQDFRIVAMELIQRSALYPLARGVVINKTNSAIYEIILLSIKPYAFEIVQNGKIVASSWYPETTQNVPDLPLPQLMEWVAYQF